MPAQCALFDPDTIGPLADTLAAEVTKHLIPDIQDAISGEVMHLPNRTTVAEGNAEVRKLTAEIRSLRETLETVAGLWTPVNSARGER